MKTYRLANFRMNPADRKFLSDEFNCIIEQAPNGWGRLTCEESDFVTIAAWINSYKDCVMMGKNTRQAWKPYNKGAAHRAFYL
jgi:hypothetical protein